MARIYILNEYDVTSEDQGARRVVATLDKEQLPYLIHQNWPAEGQEWLDEATVYLRRLVDNEHLLGLGSLELHDGDWDCRIQFHVVEAV